MEITIAIITGLTTITSAIVTSLLKDYLANRKKQKFDNFQTQIAEAVSGKWKGEITQALNGVEVSMVVLLDFKVTSLGIITGMARIPKSPTGEIIEMNLNGAFYSERFLKVSYNNVNTAVVQFGTFIFKLSGNALTLKGNFVGYGHLNENIILGKASFEKI